MRLLDALLRPGIVDPQLGELRYWWGAWTAREASCFGMRGVEARIPGTRKGVSVEARALLGSVEVAYPRLRPEILERFWEHYEPYAQMVQEQLLAEPGSHPFGRLPLSNHDATLVRSIGSPQDLWVHARLSGVSVNAYGRVGDVELRYRTAWDVEHTLGVTISNGRVTDFCGSVGPWA